MNGNISSIFNGLVEAKLLGAEDLIGCSEEEISVVREHFSGYLPASYEEFLRIAGRGAGKLFRGSCIYYPELLRLQNNAKELLLENGENMPNYALVIFMHQGYEFCCVFPSEQDPAVFQYVEGQEGLSKPWERFSDFLRSSVESHLHQWGNLRVDS